MAKGNEHDVIKEVCKGIDYEDIILFGSRARGDHASTSDYDILLVTKENLSIREKMRLSTRLRRDFAKIGIDADIIIKSRSELDYYADKIGSVTRNALKEGMAI